MAGWRFWIDRGGTFTDIVALSPEGTMEAFKVLSSGPSGQGDAAVEGIRRAMGLPVGSSIPGSLIDEVRMGTTVATNALLERKGDPTVLVTNSGLGDLLTIGHGCRPDIFALGIRLPAPLHGRVVETRARILADGTILRPLDKGAIEDLKRELTRAVHEGFSSCAIVLAHSHKWPDFEKTIASLAQECGFSEVTASHETAPLIRIIARGDTTVADSSLSPVLKKSTGELSRRLGPCGLLFMKSCGGLARSGDFRARDAILSGPAGGIIGAAAACSAEGHHRIITFDMGGTSTDVAFFSESLERDFETEIAGVRLRVPMLAIHTVASGGGSILEFDGRRCLVGPESAGADPGPKCYGNGGPLTITDCNLQLGRLHAGLFPRIFGPTGDQAPDSARVNRAFGELARRIGSIDPDPLAAGFLRIANGNMANAIRRISIQKGRDPRKCTLCCFGSAGGQHACDIADILGIEKILVPPLAGVLSALGMGLAQRRATREKTLEVPLDFQLESDIEGALTALAASAAEELSGGNPDRPGTSRLLVEKSLSVRYRGSETSLRVPWNGIAETAGAFLDAHRGLYGFAIPGRPLIAAAGQAEAIQESGHELPRLIPTPVPDGFARSSPMSFTQAWFEGEWRQTPVFWRALLGPGIRIEGPAIVADPLSSTVVTPGWVLGVTPNGSMELSRQAEGCDEEKAFPAPADSAQPPDPVLLELFSNIFMSIAEGMGETLRKTGHSVNIRERLDFSCALFDSKGRMVANAPHIPVHLGSMGECVRSLVSEISEPMLPGDSYVVNDPYLGGTHLPDVTVITPVFVKPAATPAFFVASRGHHADVGGISPGSMPHGSTTLEEEGTVISPTLLVRNGEFREKEMRRILSCENAGTHVGASDGKGALALAGSLAGALDDKVAKGRWPARNPDCNIADLLAQTAANVRGSADLSELVGIWGADTVAAYMDHVLDLGNQVIGDVISGLNPGSIVYPMDKGLVIRISVSIDRAARKARVDFSGTSAQSPGNFNAPLPVCTAAVLYVFRTLAARSIPLNEGCLRPLEIIVPEGTILNPIPPAAVAAGNVEVSQGVANALLGALGKAAASQGTMNNLTFGDESGQYYETIGGGEGAGPGFDGASGVHTHMTNSRMTDPEILESRHPVVVEETSLRRGSGGGGRFKGGDGIVRRLRFLSPMRIEVLASSREVPPFGLEGGEPGLTGGQFVEREGMEIQKGLPCMSLEANDVFVIETPGGGGWGAPDL